MVKDAENNGRREDDTGAGKGDDSDGGKGEKKPSFTEGFASLNNNASASGDQEGTRQHSSDDDDEFCDAVRVISPTIRGSILQAARAEGEREPSSVVAISKAKDDDDDDDDVKMSGDSNTMTPLRSKNINSAVPIVSPTGRIARKTAQMSPNLGNSSADSASNTTPSPPRTKKTWTEKGQTRELKSAAAAAASHSRGPQLSLQNKQDEDVVPGSFSVVTGSFTHRQNRNQRDGERNDPMHIAIDEETPPSTSNLVEATLVDPVFAEVSAIPETQQDDARSRNSMNTQALRRRRFRFIIMANVFLGLLGLGLLLFFLFWENDDPTSPAPTTMVPATNAPTGYNEFHLPLSIWETILDDPESPQALAYRWLLDDDIASMDSLETATTSVARSSNSSNATNTTAMTDTTTEDTEWRYHQRYALAVLYFATSGDTWKRNSDWLDHKKDECQWYTTAVFDGIISPCHEGENSEANSATNLVRQGQYKTLHLKGNALDGSLASDVFLLLPSLQTIDLSYNDLTNSSIATEIGHLSQLEILSLGHNSQISGALPTELGLLTSLTRIELQDNKFFGEIVSELGLLRELEILHLHENNFSKLPTEIGNMEPLLDIRLQYNRISGPIPSEIGLLPVVQDIIVEGNRLTSTIPPQLGNLTTLQTLRLKDNNISGSLPSQLGLLEDLVTLSLQRNQLSGTIPQQLLQPNLKRLLLHENALTGDLGGLFEQPLPKLERLLLYDNRLTGTLGSELGLLSNMIDCWIDANAFSGTLSSSVRRLSSLKSLRLNSTNLSGPLPPELGMLSQLEFLDISKTMLSGTVELCWLNESQLIFDCSDSLCGCDRCECPPQPEPQETAPNALNETTEESYSFSLGTGNNETTEAEALPLPPDNLEVACSFRSLATPTGLVMCQNICEQGACCWQGDAPCSARPECSRYSQSCVNLNAEGKQEQVDAACSASEDLVDCVILCADATCCFTAIAQSSCETTNPGISCADYEACNVLYN